MKTKSRAQIKIMNFSLSEIIRKYLILEVVVKDSSKRDGFLPKFLKFGTKRFDGPRLVRYNDRFIVTSDSL